MEVGKPQAEVPESGKGFLSALYHSEMWEGKREEEKKKEGRRKKRNRIYWLTKQYSTMLMWWLQTQLDLEVYISSLNLIIIFFPCSFCLYTTSLSESLSIRL